MFYSKCPERHWQSQKTFNLWIQIDATNFDYRKRVYEMKRAKEELEYQMKKVTWFNLFLIGVKPFTGMTFGRRTLRNIMLNKMMFRRILFGIMTFNRMAVWTKTFDSITFSKIIFSVMTFSGMTARTIHSVKWHSVEWQ